MYLHEKYILYFVFINVVKVDKSIDLFKCLIVMTCDYPDLQTHSRTDTANYI